MLVLCLESTCDETGASVVEDGRRVLSNVVATQVDLHAKYRGVVPEIASRAHIENLLPVLRESVTQAGCTFADLNAVAVAHRPGLIGSLLVGVTAAKTLAWALGRPLVGVDHVHAHLYSVMLERNDPPTFPAVGIVCSGGHTALYRLGSWLVGEVIGSAIDVAVGEAYDKVAALLGLGYPGGPVIDRPAAAGDPNSVKLPRSLLGRDSLDFSFSGLKTAVLYHVHGVPARGHRIDTTRPPALPEQRLRDIAASFQAACADVIAKKLKRAGKRTKARSVIVGGGVSANRGLRALLAQFPVPVHVPPLRYCTDNAAMSAGLAEVYFREGRISPLDLDAITHSQFREP